MAQRNPTENMDDMFPRLARIAGEQDFSMDSVAPRVSRLLKEEEVDPEDLQIRGQTDAEEELQAMLEEIERQKSQEGEEG